MRSASLATTLFPLLLLAGAAPAALAQDVDRGNLDARQLAVHDRAVGAFRDHRYAAAYGRFVELADAGHPPSARVALLMLHSGPALFGSDWTASADQQRRWQGVLSDGNRQRMGMVGRSDQE